MHDDQHGTAIIATAAFLNALQIAEKNPEDVKIVTVGAGAAGIACLNMLLGVGVKKENIFLCDSRGVIHTKRTNLTKEKARFAQETEMRTLADAMVGADMFLGLSVGGLVSPEMVKSMAPNPIVFALANPTPEIDYPIAKATRSDIIMATGRSDYPNQVNNVLGFPFIFRGALDVRASKINDEMKIAASQALAKLARQQITDQVRAAYGDTDFTFGPDYIIPKPFDKRVLYTVAPAVALAAMQTGVARKPIDDIESYKEELKARFYPSSAVMSRVFHKIKGHAPRIVFPEATSSSILLAVEQVAQMNIARPILIGNPEEIYNKASEIDINLHGIEVIDPNNDSNREQMVEALFHRRSRKGMTREKSLQLLSTNNDYFGAMMVETGACDGMVSGLTRPYPDVIRPVIECIGTDEDESAALCAVYLIFKDNEPYFFADTAVHVRPNAGQLARIAMTVSEFVRQLDIVPKVAMLSYSSFGSARSKESSEVAKAVDIVKNMQPELMIDGEMQVEHALQSDLREKVYHFSDLEGSANVLIFPNLDSGNISYKLMRDIGGAEAIGPVLLGLNKPAHVLQRDSDVSTIINLTAITALRSLS
jgi:malate dehydrogenase (oxaloacetate-decarboxylating)(NADP+)